MPVQSAPLGPATEAQADAPSTREVSRTAARMRMRRDMAGLHVECGKRVETEVGAWEVTELGHF